MGVREPVPTWFFAMVVVRRADEFVLVHETKHAQLYSLHGGRAEPGETLAEAKGLFISIDFDRFTSPTRPGGLGHIVPKSQLLENVSADSKTDHS